MDTIDNVYENGAVLKEAFSTAKPLDYEVLPHFDNILLEHPPAESSVAHGDNIYYWLAWRKVYSEVSVTRYTQMLALIDWLLDIRLC